MAEQKRVTQTTEVTTETSEHTPMHADKTYRKETTVTTERKVEKEPDPTVIIETTETTE